MRMRGLTGNMLMWSRFMSRAAGLLMVLTLMTQASGCGYTFQGAGSVLPPDVTRVYIPMVENHSAENGFSSTMTEALRERFERYGVVNVVETAGEADAILNVTVNRVQQGTQSVTSTTDTALQQNTTVTLSGELRRLSGEILWRNPSIRISRAFGTASQAVVTSSVDFASGSLGAGDLGSLDNRELSRGQEREALTTLAEEAAASIYDEAVAPDF